MRRRTKSKETMKRRLRSGRIATAEKQRDTGPKGTFFNFGFERAYQPFRSGLDLVRRSRLYYWLDSRYGGRGQNHDLAGYEVLSLVTNNFNNVDDCLQTQCKTSKRYLPNINRLRGPKWGLFGSFWPVRLVSNFNTSSNRLIHYVMHPFPSLLFC